MQLVKPMFVAAAILALSGQSAVPAPVPVVVELFTSEGCSSCPPADALLIKLLAEQPVPGVQVIPLGMHVTYWDQLGWKDPSSLALATKRQQDYSKIFGEDKVYTPQAVVDGREELVGSDEAGVKRAIAKAAKQPHARVTVTPIADAGQSAFTVRVDDIPADVKEPLDMVSLLVEDGLTTVVKRGENGGRTLHHVAVVRHLDPAAGGRVRVPELSRDWRRESLRLVVLVQGQKSRRVYGATTTALK